jgi:DNA primase
VHAAMAAPSMYVAWRMKAHRAQKLRCDWLRN